MGKFDPDRAGGERRKKIKNPKFRHHYDEAYSDEDIDDLYSRKKKLKQNHKRDRDRETDWPEA